MEIVSRDNPKIKNLVKLISSKKERQAQNSYVIEGVRSCADAFKDRAQGRLRIVGVFSTSEALDKCRTMLDADIFEMGTNGVLMQVISKELALKISDEGNTQGIFAVAQMRDRSLPERLDGSRYLVLDNLQDPGNLGTVLRTADAVGLDGVILTNSCCELYNPKTVRSTMGSLSRVNIYIENDFEKVLNCLKSSGARIVASVVKEGRMISSYSFDKKCAVVIGNEGRGMSDEHIAKCDDNVTIDMRGNLDSLNASVAAAVFMWEMTKNAV